LKPVTHHNPHSAPSTVSFYVDNNGNLLTRENKAEARTYTWDSENRLLKAEVTTEAGTVESQYRYNADGVRVASIVDGEETHYLIDANRPHAQVLVESATDGTVLASYVYGQDLIAQVREGETSFYHTDGLGSTRLKG
jgi:uncharacterized protein RhaS with RHS repeats